MLIDIADLREQQAPLVIDRPFSDEELGLSPHGIVLKAPVQTAMTISALSYWRRTTPT